ncbi:hypothetical protein GCM10011430_08940 [Oxalicibacterium solurbis]|uniref:Uncharacterized protein n=1 Tax=Oxalicibacterium solurbis TaxID=69280 RepID=A0A8J3AUZ5_9BURK|nr:hypothetical protein GCM10011430_08940 [Oxalicibacterium solurbis]
MDEPGDSCRWRRANSVAWQKQGRKDATGKAKMRLSAHLRTALPQPQDCKFYKNNL